MNNNLINYLASGILGTVLGVVTLVGAGDSRMEVACDRQDDCRSEAVTLWLADDPGYDDERSVETHLACSASDGCDDRVVPCDPGVDCMRGRVAPCDSSNPSCGNGRTGDILLADDGSSGDDDRVAPCSSPDCHAERIEARAKV